jgi:rubrerythrin
MVQETTNRPATDYPVDDATYNLLQALTSKLEAIEAYEQYQADDPEGVFGQLIDDERRHATALLDALRVRLGSS